MASESDSERGSGPAGLDETERPPAGAGAGPQPSPLTSLFDRATEPFYRRPNTSITLVSALILAVLAYRAVVAGFVEPAPEPGGTPPPVSATTSRSSSVDDVAPRIGAGAGTTVAGSEPVAVDQPGGS